MRYQPYMLKGYLIGFLLVFAIFALVVLLPMLISYFNRRDRRLNFIFIIPISVIGYSIYFAIYPKDDFYQHDFKAVTGLDFPVDGQILYKSATFPDQHGDYTSVSVTKVGRDFYFALPEKLQQKGLTEDKTSYRPNEMDEALTHVNGEIIMAFTSSDERGSRSYVGLLSDKETVVVERA